MNRQDIVCKYCNSANTVKFGTYGSTQLYFCKDCKRKFTALDTLFKMKTPVDQIATAMSMYYSGISLDGIQRNLKQQYGNDLSEMTIHNWLLRFTREAVLKAMKFKPKVGNVWLADETMVDIMGQKWWVWDIIDSDTRFLLASHISSNRTTEDAQILIRRAVQRAGKFPQVIITDKLKAYIDGIDLVLGDKTKHIRSSPFTGEDSTNLIERFQGTLKDRTKTLRGFKRLDNARLITEGFLVHYNFFKQHEAIGNVPPAQNMGRELPFRDWNDVVRTSGRETETGVDLAQAFAVPIKMPMTNKLIKKQYMRKAVAKSRAKRKRQVQTPQPKVIVARGL
ncbi:MAG: IS6 family transposase [Chloroflexi bacterium]|nr:IS6 family transposase [Chloroflexota bacterium]